MAARPPAWAALRLKAEDRANSEQRYAFETIADVRCASSGGSCRGGAAVELAPPDCYTLFMAHTGTHAATSRIRT